MLKLRIIPTLLWKKVGLVKGVAFDSWRRVGTLMPAIKVYNTRDVDELILLDIAATLDAFEPDYESVAEVAAECFVPLTVGGGITNCEMIRKLLRAGADKVSINSSAYARPGFIAEASRRFGAQCVVASIDVMKRPGGGFECYSHAGTRATGIELGAWARELEGLGAGELLITSIEREGTQQGYDLDMLRTVTGRVGIPVIASGGAGNYQHLYDAFVVGKASAVAAASIFHFTEQTPAEAKRFLAAQGLPVRNSSVGKMGFHGSIQV